MKPNINQQANCHTGITSTRGFLVVALILLVVIIFLPHLKTGFTTYDDTRTALTAEKFKSGNISDFLTQAFKSATGQGRISQVLSAPLTFAPYLVENAVYYQSFRLGSVVLNLILFFGVLFFFSKSSLFAFFTTTLALCFLQNNWQHNLLTSYPFKFHFGLSCFFLSFIFFLKDIQRNKLIWKFLAGSLFLFSIMIYEAFVPYVLIYLGLAMSYKFIKEDFSKHTLMEIGRLISPICICVGIYLIVYLTFRWTHPSTYAGVQLAPFSLLKTMKVVWQFSVSTLPTYFYFFNVNGISQTFDGFLPHKVGIVPLFLNLKVEWLVKAIIASYVCWVVLFKKQIVFTRLSFLLTVCFGLALIILPQSLLAFTTKYQVWVIKSGVLAYTHSYFSYFGTILVLSSSIFFINQILGSKKLIRTLFSVLCSAIILIANLMTDYSNYYITLDQQLSQVKWITFNQFLKTNEFKEIPDGSLIYAPTLWQVWRGIVNHSHDSTYWSEYARQKTKKSIEITNSPSELDRHFSSKEASNIYFLSFNQEPKAKNQYLVFARLHNPHLLASKEVCLYTHSKYRRFTLIGTFTREKDKAEIAVNGKRISPQVIGQHFFSHRIDNSVNAERFPKTQIKSNVSIDLENIIVSFFDITANLSGIMVKFENGFWNPEKDEYGSTWRWTKGDAVILLHNRLQTPVKCYLDFALNTILPRNVMIGTNKRTIDVLLKAKETYFVKDLEVELQPGENQLLFHTDVPAQQFLNTDPRNLAFRIINFKLMKKIE